MAIRSGLVRCWRLGIVWACLAAPLPAAGADVLARFDAAGLRSLTVNGREILAEETPGLTHVVLEKRDLAKPGLKGYTFEKPDVSKPQASFDAGAKTVRHAHAWGTVEWAYRPGRDRLTVAVTIRNTSDRALATFGLTLCRLKLPPPEGSKPKRRGRVVCTQDNLGVVTADHGQGKLLACYETIDPPIHFGLDEAADKAAGVFPVRMRGEVCAPEPGSTVIAPYGLPRIGPGKSLALTFSLRFAAADADTGKLLADLYERFGAVHKPTLTWKDRRPIGMVMLSSSFPGHVSKTNPRGWFNDKAIDIRDKQAFRKRVLRAAARSVQALRDAGAQGMIVWDIEASQHRQITYVGDPRLARTLAPEMDAVADEYFRTFRQAHLRTGVCIRPTQVYFDAKKGKWSHGTGSDGSPQRGDHYPHLRPKGTPWWRFFPVVERMCDKIAYAKKRWGCTLYYIDTNGTWRPCGPDGKFRWLLMNAHMLRAIRARHPDVLLIPELTRAGGTFHAAYWSYAAPYFELDLGGTSTPAHVRKLLPGAFSIINISDGPFDEKRPLLLAGVRRGDILLFHGWYGARRNAKVRALYEEAASKKRPAGGTFKRRGSPDAHQPFPGSSLFDRFRGGNNGAARKYREHRGLWGRSSCGQAPGA